MAETIPPIDVLVEQAREVFVQEFGETPNTIVSAPGRVNLIGEHVDYCGGFVLPMALPMATIIVGKKIEGEQSEIVTMCTSADDPKRVTLEMPAKEAPIRAFVEKTPKWANYIRGIIVEYKGSLNAFKAAIVSTVPLGAGVSSSAALEVSMYTFLDALNGVATIVPDTDKALACQKAENEHAGVPCGIMDQFISTMGKKGNVLLIDCRALTSELIPFDDPDVVILITNSNVKHELVGTEYSDRRKQCQEAAQLIKKESLRDATPKDICYLECIEADPVLIKRARHVVGENDRVLQAVEALKDKDYKKFGELMVQSHNSLRDDFEVSCPEMDQLVELAMASEGVLGSRMTGGGFGGSTVTLVPTTAVEDAIQNIKNGYNGTATFYICQPSDGAHVLSCCGA